MIIYNNQLLLQIRQADLKSSCCSLTHCHCSIKLVEMYPIVTARKRSLGQRNFLLCLSFCPQVEGLASQHASQVTWSAAKGSPSKEGVHWGVCIQGGLDPGEICIKGESASRGVCLQRG